MNIDKNIDFKEIEQFSKDSHQWWNEEGPFAPLHKLNPERIEFILTQLISELDLDESSLTPLSSLSIIDIGCGGGLVCEPLHRLGASMTGLDADQQAISVAKHHAQEQGFEINYQCEDSVSFSHKNSELYDVVLALEIIEHIPDIKVFLDSLVQLCKPGGIIIISTLNRTAKSFALGIVAAEYILNWVPKGTHSWKKFLKPSEIVSYLDQHSVKPICIRGMIYNPLTQEFKISEKDLDVNYFLVSKKEKQ